MNSHNEQNSDIQEDPLHPKCKYLVKIPASEFINTQNHFPLKFALALLLKVQAPTFHL